MSPRALLVSIAALAGCAAPAPAPVPNPEIAAVISKTAERKPEARPEAIQNALLPPLRMEMPDAGALAIEPRFDLAVSNSPAPQVFMSIVAGTRYSMLVHPSVRGNVSVSLKDVTVREALAAIRDLYGYEYRIEGSRIFIEPMGLQTRVFQVSYLAGQRRGISEMRVQSGAVSDIAPTGAGGAATPGVPGAPAQQASRSLESSRVTTQHLSTFWTDICEALAAIVFPPEAGARAEAAGPVEDRQRNACNRRHAASDRSIVVSPQSGVIVVRATGAELRSVEQYLRATRVAVERQVMLEAKIVEVTLSDAYQAGINWAVLGRHLAIGQLSTNERGSTVLGPRGTTIGTGPQAGGLTADVADKALAATAGALATGNPAGGVFGLALQTSNFAALLSFLESQGSVQVLSSPRIATINNQKAILKVGTDEFFVTNVSSSTTATVTGTQTAPTITVQPFFSGILLDVTPQIDADGNIILHIHPAVSEVTESTRVVNLGADIAEIRLPLARSQVSETDTIVRVADGNIVAIGGLMSVDVRDFRGGVPGVPDEGFGRILRNSDKRLVKKELVILLKPTVIASDRQWEQDLRETRGRFEALGVPAGPARAPAR